MLTKVTIRNFKRFDEVSVDLGSPVVFVGPNNSGKTTVMQALTLWDIGVRRWKEKQDDADTPEERSRATIGRRDLVAIPSPDASLLWKDLRVRDREKEDGRESTGNVRMEIIVEGTTGAWGWECGLEFDYENEESFYCRPLRKSGGGHPDRMPVPEGVGETPVVFLAPMSGLAETEMRLDPGAVDVKVGEGRTAEILRNLCHRLAERSEAEWKSLARRIEGLFGVRLEEPRYVPGRGEVTMAYEENGIRLDLSSAGRGLQQTLLLLSFMRLNPGAVLLLDEPDAHLEILRQRQTYGVITEEAKRHGSQIIAASHSEVFLDEAMRGDRVVSFVGKPHSLDFNPAGPAWKALAELGFDQRDLAEQKGWVLYLGGPKDLSILREFARRLGDTEAQEVLDMPFVRYVENSPDAVLHHYHSLRGAFPGLGGVALFDRMEAGDRDEGRLVLTSWKKREIENYFCTKAALEAYARDLAVEMSVPLLMGEWQERMRENIASLVDALEILGIEVPWGNDIKAGDDFLVPLFRNFHQRIGEHNRMGKRNLHGLVKFLPNEEIDPEIGEKLDAIKKVAQDARLRQ